MNCSCCVAALVWVGSCGGIIAVLQNQLYFFKDESGLLALRCGFLIALGMALLGVLLAVDFNPVPQLAFYAVWGVLLIAAIAWGAIADWKVQAGRWDAGRAVAGQWGRKAGFRFADVPLRSRADRDFVAVHRLPEDLRRLQFFHDCSDDGILSIPWMMAKTTVNGEVLLFRHVVGSAGSSAEISNLAVAFRDNRMALPELVLAPRVPLDSLPLDRLPLSWIAGRVPREQQVVLNNRTAFMEWFVLYGPDPAAIELVFTNKRLDFLESECRIGDPPPDISLWARRRWHARAWDNTWCLDGSGSWLLANRPVVDEKQFEPLHPDRIDSLLESATRVYQAFLPSEHESGGLR